MKTIQEIVTILTSSDNPSKVLILQSMVKNPPDCPDNTFFEILRNLVHDDDIAVRFWSKKVKAKYPGLEKESAPFIDQMPVAAPANNQEPLPLDLLMKKLGMENTQRSSFVGMDVIAKILEKRDIETVEPLFEYLEKCQDVVQVSFLVKHLGISFPTEENLIRLARYLKHEDDRVVANTIEGLEEIPSPKVVVLVSQLLNHHNHRVRANAAKALNKQEPEIARCTISRMLHANESPHFIIAACFAASSLRDVHFLPELVTLIDDSLVGDSALNAIVGIGGESAIGYLEAKKENAVSDIQVKIEKAIEKIQFYLKAQQVKDQVASKVKESVETAGKVSEKIGASIQAVRKDFANQEKRDEAIKRGKEILNSAGKTLSDTTSSTIKKGKTVVGQILDSIQKKIDDGKSASGNAAASSPMVFFRFVIPRFVLALVLGIACLILFKPLISSACILMTTYAMVGIAWPKLVKQPTRVRALKVFAWVFLFSVLIMAAIQPGTVSKLENGGVQSLPNSRRDKDVSAFPGVKQGKQTADFQTRKIEYEGAHVESFNGVKSALSEISDPIKAQEFLQSIIGSYHTFLKYGGEGAWSFEGNGIVRYDKYGTVLSFVATPIQENLLKARFVRCIGKIKYIEFGSMFNKDNVTLEVFEILNSLECAIDLEDLEMVKLFSSKAEELNSQQVTILGGKEYSFSDFPPIWKAVLSDNLEIVKILLENGADPDGWCKYNCPLACAAGRTNSVEIAKLLIKFGANINKQDGISRDTPLSMCILERNVEMVKLLLDNGADSSIRVREGKTLIEYAKEIKGHSNQDEKIDQIIELLVSSRQR